YRDRQLIEACIIAQLADHSASCAVTKAKVGDRIVLLHKKHLVQKVAADKPQQTSSIVLYQTAQTTTFEKIVYQATPKSKAKRVAAVKDVQKVQASLGHQTWVASGSRTFHQENANLSLYKAPIGASGFSTTVDLSTYYWTAAPTDQRFRQGASMQLYAWQLSLDYASQENSVRASLGRIRPWEIPGVSSLDGGYFSLAVLPNLRTGIYGGLRPDVVSLEPSLEHWETGVFVDHSIYQNQNMTMDQQLRVSYLDGSSDSSAVELEHLLQAHLFQFVSAYIQSKFQLLGTGGFSFDETRADAWITPMDLFKIRLGGRFIEHQDAQSAFLQDNRSRRADTSVYYQVHPLFELAMHAGLIKETGGDGKQRVFIGPEVHSPELFGSKGGMTVGHQQEWGWTQGHSTFIRPSYDIYHNVNLASQISYTHELQSNSTYDEWLGSIFISSQLSKLLRSSLSFYTRIGGQVTGFGGQVSLTGSI
ncbi:MAG: hypothetical protein KDK51_05780, partial [Deltaproteobacteria bacterium]|nr:hypothetical protein [Deltaproteobacteria bacterium]